MSLDKGGCWRSNKPVDWKPSSSFQEIQRRSKILHTLRDYFYQAGVMEVDVPILSQFATVDPHIDSFDVVMNVFDGKALYYYLHTSPEFSMKRLLALGSDDIYFLGMFLGRKKSENIIIQNLRC